MRWYGWVEILMQAEDPGAAAGGAPGGGAAAPGLSELLRSFFPVIMIVVFLYLFVFRHESKKRKERELRIKSVKKGDTILTTGGLLGEVVRVDPTEVVVMIDDDKKVKARVARGAVHEILSALPEGDAKSAGLEEPSVPAAPSGGGR